MLEMTEFEPDRYIQVMELNGDGVRIRCCNELYITSNKTRDTFKKKNKPGRVVWV